MLVQAVVKASSLVPCSPNRTQRRVSPSFRSNRAHRKRDFHFARVALQEIDESLESPVPPRATHDVPKGAPIAKLNYMKAPSTDSIDLTPHATQEPIDDTITIPGNRVPFATQEERETADRISQRARTPPLVVELEDSADAYNKEMAELLNKSKPFVLLSVWKKMQSANVKPNEYSYLSVLDACERLQKPQLATSLLSDMVKAGLEPTAAHYAFTIGSLVNIGDTNTALELVAQWRREGGRSSPIILLRVVRVAATTGDVEVAKEVMKELKSLDRRDPGSFPLIDAYKYTLRALCAAGAAADALELFLEGRSVPYINVDPFADIVFECCLETNHVDGLADLLMEMSRYNPGYLNDGMRLRAMECAARVTPPRFVFVEKMWESYRQATIKPPQPAFTAMLFAYTRGKLFKKAFRFISDNPSYVIHSVMFVMIADGIGESIESLDKAYVIADSLYREGVRLPLVVMNMLIKAASELKDMDRAYGIYEHLSDFGLHATTGTFRALFRGAAATGITQHAAFLLSKMQALNLKMTPAIVHQIVACHVQAGDLRGALKHYEQALQDKMQIEYNTCKMLVLAFMQKSDLGFADELADDPRLPKQFGARLKGVIACGIPVNKIDPLRTR